MIARQIPPDDQARQGFEVRDDAVRDLAPNPGCRRLSIVNVVFFGRPGDDRVPLGGGLPGTAWMVAYSAEARFGDRAPLPIGLTRGHMGRVFAGADAGGTMERADMSTSAGGAVSDPDPHVAVAARAIKRNRRAPLREAKNT